MFSKRIQREKRGCIKIAVAGVCNGAGATHFSILLANYFSEILGYKTAIIDLNRDNHYEQLKRICLSDKNYKNVYQIKRVNYFSMMNKENVAEVFEDNFDCIILDVGINLNNFQNEISMCDKKFLACTVNPWRMEDTLAFVNTNIASVKKDTWKYLYSNGDFESAQYFMDKTKVIIKGVPNIENPFKINGKQLTAMEKIIWEE